MFSFIAKQLRKVAVTASLLLVLAITLVFAIPVIAAWSADITVTENGTGSHTMVGCNITANIDYMAGANWFDSVNGTDTRVLQGNTAIPHMLADDRIMFAVPVTANSTNTYQFATHYTDQDFSIIPGYGGYITVADDADLELSDNSSIEINCWIDTVAGNNKNLVHKEEALKIFVSDAVSGNVTAIIYDSSASTANLTPNAAGDYTNIVTQFPAANEHWDKVDDAVGANDGDTTYIKSANLTQVKDAYNLISGSIPVDATISSIAVKHRARTTNAGNPAFTQPYLRLDTNETAGTELTITDTDYNTLQSETLTRPGGGDWNISDIADLQVAIGLRHTSGYEARITQVYVTVIYYLAASTVTASDVPSGEHTVTVELVTDGTLIDETDETGGATGSHYFSNDGRIQAQTFTPSADWMVDSIEASYRRSGASIGTVSVNITTTDGSGYPATVLGTATFDGTQLPIASFASFTANFTSPVNLTSGTVYAITWQQSGNNGTDLAWRDPGQYTSGALYGSTDYGNTWTVSSTIDHAFELLSNRLALYIDDILVDSVCPGATVPDNANDWEFFRGNSVPYSDNISISVNSTRQLYFAPNDIISSSTLPDREVTGGDNDGTFIWGSNATGISVSIASLESTDVITLVEDELTTPSTTGNLTMPAGMYPTDMSGTDNPFYWIPEFINDFTDMPIPILWYFFYGFVMIVAMAAVYKFSRHLFLMGIVGMIITGAFVGLQTTAGVAQGVIPWWFFIPLAIFTIWSAVSERSPTL